MSEFPCESCGSKKRFHKKDCPVKAKNHVEPSEVQEQIRTPENVPRLGEWYVLYFGVPKGFNTDTGHQTWNPVVELAPVGSVRNHGRDYLVNFDMDQAKIFTGRVDGELYSPAEDVIKALRRMADDMERAVK